ncbi:MULTISPECIES: hypothetical protein [Rodentibacter]|uniref:DNA-binding protein n=1 Tax=Rodentibacter ratti TaxID=1906745 RepID=A0A1V3KXV1_9PAST|nr:MULTISPECIES: hypothetical protein [Rodentibacter]OOF60823.1 hypothetical protein BH925_04100 [Rodentibacter pneumotropicus]OOF64791.1 hypothetical protein BKL50_00865 [Rodentibacter pneumotropicus]OOF82150.1 hypothetical protein BKG92_07215 [Rodentibacter ratti]THA14849.1 hypothetical protein D3M83_10785 [Rodentibacter pneumotropicus]
MVTNEQVMEKLVELEGLLARQAIHENSKELWDINQVAEYFGYTVRHMREVAADPFFPRPVQVPSQRNLNQPTNQVRYFVGEIVQYAKHRQQRRKMF